MFAVVLSRGSPDAPLHKTYVAMILRAFVDLMRTSAATEAVVDVDVPAAPSATMNNNKVVVVGDTHGQLQDYLFILRHHGLPSRTNVYMVNGDIADRGAYAVEIFLTLALFKLSDPAAEDKSKKSALAEASEVATESEQRFRRALMAMLLRYLFG